MIHLWNTSAIVEEISRGALSSRSKMQYLMAGALIAAVTPYVTYFVFQDVRYLEWLVACEGILAAGVAIVGTLRCYAANGADAGRDFIERFVCIGVPVGLKITAAACLLHIAALRVFDLAIASVTVQTEAAAKSGALLAGQVLEFIPFVIGIGSIIAFYSRIAVHLSRIRGVGGSPI